MVSGSLKQGMKWYQGVYNKEGNGIRVHNKEEVYSKEGNGMSL